MKQAISKFRKFIRKRAIKKVNKNIAYQQKSVSDYTKDELRKLIELVGVSVSVDFLS